jgi:hypothetical protein
MSPLLASTPDGGFVTASVDVTRVQAYMSAIPACCGVHLQTHKDLAAAVKGVVDALNRSKDTSTAQADLDFAKGVAAGMEGVAGK